MNIWQILETGVERAADRCAIVDGQVRLTYAQLIGRVRRLAGYLQDRSVREGDRIAILEHNSHVFLEAYFAAAGLGAILCPLNTRLRPADLGGILDDARPRWLLARGSFSFVEEIVGARTSIDGVVWIGGTRGAPGDIEALAYESIVDSASDSFTARSPAGDAPAHLYYTSGTTGRPKGVVLTHRNVCVHAQAAIEEFSLSESDTWGHFAPMFHLADAWATFAVTWVGGSHVFTPVFEPGEVLRALDREGVTLTNLVPTMLNDLLHHTGGRAPRHRLRLLLTGGAPIAASLVRRAIEAFGCEYAQTYGLTETSPYLTVSLLNDRLRARPVEEQLAYRATTGRPFLPVRLRVVLADGTDVRHDGVQVGEIRVRGDTVFPGYWERPDETARAFVDGWFRTGDLAVVNPEGYLTIVDRLKDMIITGGENVYSVEVENVLFSHPDVREAAVFGVPDERWGERVVAAVVVRGGAAIDEPSIIRHCGERLAAFKVPKRIHALGSLPRTGSGKIHKPSLRERFGGSRD